jgi:hypothetical protein
MNTRILYMFGWILTAWTVAQAKGEFEMKPALLDSDGEDGLVGALRFDGKYVFQPETAANQLLKLMATTKGTLATKPRAHGERLLVDFSGMYFINLDPPPESAAAPDPNERNPNFIPTAPIVKPGFGGLEFGAASSFEADQPFDNQVWTIGGRMNYIPSNAGILSSPLVPHVWMDYRWVHEINSKTTGPSRSSFGRLGLSLDWQLPIGAWLTPEGSMFHAAKLVPNFQYYRSTQETLAVGGSDLNDAYYTSVSLDYPAPRIWRWISAIRITYADGRIPPATRTHRTVDFAIVVKWSKK